MGGTVTVNDLLVSGQDDEKDYRFVSVPEILLTLGAGNLLAGEIFLDEILCHKPEVNFLLKPDGVFYLPMLIMAATDNEQKSAAATRPGKSENATETADNFIFKLGKLHLDDGVVAVYDKRVSPAFSTRFTPVNFTLENMTTVAGDHARYELNLQSDLGESFAASGDLSLDPLEVKTHFDLQGLSLPNYAAYYRDYFTGRFSSGQVGVRGDVTVAKTPAGEISMLLQGFECKLDNCKLSTPDDKLVLDLPRFALAQTLIDFDKRECVIGSIEGERGSLNLIRRDDGTLNLVDLLPQAVQPQEVNPDNPKKIDSAVVSAPNQTTEKPWHLLLAKAHLQGFAVDFKDLVPRDDSVIKADKITLDIEQLGTGAGESGNLSLDMRLAGKGKLSVKGAVGVDPLKVELNINLQKMPLQVLQNYLNEHLELVLVSGRVATKCRLLLHEDGANENRIKFSGDLSLDNLKTVDNERAADIFSLRHLELNRLNYDSRSPALSLHRALFEGLQVNVVKGGDGLTNLEKIVIKDESAETPLVDTDQPQVAEKPKALALDFKQLEFTDS
ncbi:MAG: DUF748 domain-containing protein, partial [Deltaproteobacteria bacterium]|nr:DUF748 domain-containing protein [Deltaproteobacteria bacterium]